MQKEMKWYIFVTVQQLRKIATLKRKLRSKMGLLNTLQDEEGDSICQGDEDPGPHGDGLAGDHVDAERRADHRLHVRADDGDFHHRPEDQPTKMFFE